MSWTGVILFVTWLITISRYYTIKLLEKLLMLCFRISDKNLSIFVDGSPLLKNTDKQEFDILTAFTEHGRVRNKLKLFLRFYWESQSDEFERHGFDFANFARLMKCNRLYCNYIIHNKIFNFIINMEGDECTKTINDKITRLIFRHVDFDGDNTYIGLPNKDLSKMIDDMRASLD